MSPSSSGARVGDAVAHGFVHRRAERLGEAHVVARRGVRAVGDGHHVAYPVEKVGGDPRLDRTRHRVHDVPPQTTRRAHLRHRRVALHLQLSLPPRVELLLRPARGRVVGQGTQPPRGDARDRTPGTHQVRTQRPGPRELRRRGGPPVVPGAGSLQVIRPTRFCFFVILRPGRVPAPRRLRAARRPKPAGVLDGVHPPVRGRARPRGSHACQCVTLSVPVAHVARRLRLRRRVAKLDARDFILRLRVAAPALAAAGTASVVVLAGGARRLSRGHVLLLARILRRGVTLALVLSEVEHRVVHVAGEVHGVPARGGGGGGGYDARADAHVLAEHDVQGHGLGAVRDQRCEHVRRACGARGGGGQQKREGGGAARRRDGGGDTRKPSTHLCRLDISRRRARARRGRRRPGSPAWRV